MKLSMRFAATLLAALLVSPSVFADSLESRDAAVALTDKVMARVAKGEFREGLAMTRPYTIIPAAEFDAMIGQVELQMPVMLSRFGKSIGYELLRNDTVGESLTQVVYLQRFEKHATVWRFVLYRGADGWVVNSFNFVDNISSAF